MEYINLLKLRKEVLSIYNKKFYMKNPNKLHYKNQALKMKLLSKYNLINSIKNKIMFASKEELNLIKLDLKEVS